MTQDVREGGSKAMGSETGTTRPEPQNEASSDAESYTGVIRSDPARMNTYLDAISELSPINRPAEHWVKFSTRCAIAEACMAVADTEQAALKENWQSDVNDLSEGWHSEAERLTRERDDARQRLQHVIWLENALRKERDEARAMIAKLNAEIESLKSVRFGVGTGANPSAILWGGPLDPCVSQVLPALIPGQFDFDAARKRASEVLARDYDRMRRVREQRETSKVSRLAAARATIARMRTGRP